MSCRPRRSCARGDNSVLSPSTIFLWSDTRLRQELTRRGLSRAGMRQDLIDRLLAAINGIITDDAKDSNENTPSNTSGPEKSLIEANVQSDLESADKEASSFNKDEASSTSKKGKRKTATTSEGAVLTKGKRVKLNSSQKALRLKSTKTSNETPLSRPRKQRTRASAGEDKVLLEDVSGVDIEKKSCCVIANITTVAAPSCMEATLISKSSSKETATVRCEGAAVISMTSSESVAGSPKLSSKTAADSPKFPTKSTTGSPKTSSKLAVSSPKPSKEWPGPSEEAASRGSISRPILSILPKVRPLPPSSMVSSVSSTSSVTSADISSKSEKRPHTASFTSTVANDEIFDSNTEEQEKEKPVTAKPTTNKRSSVATSSTSTQGTVPSSKRSYTQKDDDDRHYQRKSSQASGATKHERINPSKPITEAWAERLAQLKKADPLKFAGGATAKEKTKERETGMRRKPSASKASTSSAGTTTSNFAKKPVNVGRSDPQRLDLLDSILTQQSEFLQTMRRSDDRNSPDQVKIEPPSDQPEGSEDSTTEKAKELSSAAEEAYRRFERTFAESSSSKSSPKSPLFSPLPPPPPPPKPVIQPNSSKKPPSVNSDMMHLLVPPPPPPPPMPSVVKEPPPPPPPPLPPRTVKDLPPPPPPPRRLRANALDDLPPPPPPPKRLKPARPTPAKAKTDIEEPAVIVESSKQQVTNHVESSKVEETAVFNEVKACMEHVVLLVSSIKPFDEISGELLPSEAVLEPFSRRPEQRATAETLSEVQVATVVQKNQQDVQQESSAAIEESPNEQSKNDDDEEYDPLDATVVEDFEAYVPSAVVSRNVTLDDIHDSPNPSTEDMGFIDEEQYSPPPHTGYHMDDEEDEGEITEDSDCDVNSLADDSDDDSDCEEPELEGKVLMRQDESGQLLRIVRRARKRSSRIDKMNSDQHEGFQPSSEMLTAEEETAEFKPDPEILHDPRHLLQRASAVLQGLGAREGTQYGQMPYDDDYEVEECVQPMDSFHGEPVPDDDELFEVAAGIKPKRKEEVIIEEPVSVSTEKFEIDFYNGDLHLKGAPDKDWVIDPDNQDGLALVWGGVKSTRGILSNCSTSDGSNTESQDENSLQSVVFQVKITDLLSTRHLPFDELDPNDVRVGFSLRSAPLVLGEYAGSYCCTSLGKRASGNVFTDYGDSFGLGDVITAQMDFKTGNISFWKNLECMGVAFSNVVIPENEALYPHICVKNCRVAVNFGTFPGGEEEWKRLPEWIFPNSLPSSLTERTPVPPESKSDCTLLMMVGLPSVGKTTWVRRYIRDHPSEHWTLISGDTILAAMKVNGVSRNSSHIGRWDMVLGLVGKARNRLLSLAARRRRNYILDFTNCDPDTRKKRLALFEGFFRQCVTIVPSDEVMQQRHAKHLRQNRGEGTAAVPIETFLELKAVMEMPVVSEFLESVIYVDPAMEDAQIAIDRIAKFNEEGRPWYSSKYNKKRCFWSGTYGDEPYRKPSATRPQASTVEKIHPEISAAVSTIPNGSPAVARISLEKASIQPLPGTQPKQHSPAIDQSEKLSEKVIPLSIIGNENTAVASYLGATISSSTIGSPSTTRKDDQSLSCISMVFSQPPPAIPPPAPIVQPTPADLSSVINPTPLVVRTVPAEPPPPPLPQSQISNFSPRNRWDAPPPALPNFSVPPPSLVTPNLFVPNAVSIPPAMIPLLPNTSIPPPNVPPPGWPPHQLG